MKLAVVGSRAFNDYEQMKSTLDSINDITKIISGGAKGADSLAERYALEHNIELEVIPAEWDKYGKKAGMLRNGAIVERCDKLIAFWDGQSRGTLNSITRAMKANKLLGVENVK